MKYKLDPLSPYGLSPDIDYTQIAMSAGINLGAHTTDELPEGSTNLYSQWEVTSFNGADYLNPKDSETGLIIGQAVDSSVSSFAGATAIFNDSASQGGGGLNYFLNLAYGLSLIPLGGVFLGGRARGTAASPTQTLSGDYLGVLGWTGYDGTTSWPITSSNGHLLSGLWTAAADDVGTYLETDVWLGSLFYKMIGYETDTNNINFNEGQLDANITFYYDSGVALAIDGGTGDITSSTVGTATNSLANIDTIQTFTNKRVTPRVGTTTSSATPTINTDSYDVYGLTAQAADITSFTTNLSGTPTNGQKLWIYVVGTAARAITWGSSFENGASTLPTTTVGTERLDVGFVWNAVSSKWRCMAAGSA